jgi:GNAT superfamily N-acetyltransferase
MPDQAVVLQSACSDDFEALLALRLRAMRHSLTQLGRYDEQRARERLADGFDASQTQHIVVQGQRVGFLVWKRLDQVLQLDHLYINPPAQGSGIGGQVLRGVCAQADELGLAVTLHALKGSDANRFYQQHGFVMTGHSEWDNNYLRAPQTPAMRTVRALWAAFQARDWPAARALVHVDMQTTWRASGERFVGADAFIEANARYPEGWTIHLLELAQLQDGRVWSQVRVDHAPHSYFASSLWCVAEGLITMLDETWATAESPPAWRSMLPGRTLFDPRVDARARTP